MKRFSLLLTAILIFCFCACSNESGYDEQTSQEETEIKAITSVADMPEEIQKIIAESKPYISPEMQELINMLDTVTTVRPIEDVLPFLFSEEPFEPLPTRSSTLPTMTFTGFYDFFTVLQPTTVTLTSYSSSALRQSLNMYDTMLPNQSLLTVSFWAYTQNVYFTSPISYIGGLPKHADKIGLDPSKIPSVISNSTAVSRGCVAQPLVPGIAYQLTTYVLCINYAVNGAGPFIFPSYTSDMMQIDQDYSRWGRNIEWTVYAF